MTLSENELNPLRILDFETGQMNPNVFDLEIDPLIQGLAGKIHLPGTTRTKPKNSKSKAVNKRELHEIDSAGLGTVLRVVSSVHKTGIKGWIFSPKIKGWIFSP